jgi:uncharacterized protein YxjI
MPRSLDRKRPHSREGRAFVDARLDQHPSARVREGGGVLGGVGDAAGNQQYEINKSLAHVHQTFEVKKGDEVVATIQKALVNLFGDHFTVTLANEDELVVKGDWIAREFHISRAGSDLIFASRRLLSIRDSYGVQIAPDFEVPLALAIVVALEQIQLEDNHQ